MQCTSSDKVKSKAPNRSCTWVFGPLNYQTIVTVGHNSLPHYGALFFLSRHDVTSFIYSTKWPCTEMLEKWLTLKTVQRPEAPQGYGALNKIHDPNILWHNLIMLMIIVLISETLTVAMWTKSAKPSNIFSSSFEIHCCKNDRKILTDAIRGCGPWWCGFYFTGTINLTMVF